MSRNSSYYTILTRLPIACLLPLIRRYYGVAWPMTADHRVRGRGCHDDNYKSTFVNDSLQSVLRCVESARPCDPRLPPDLVHDSPTGDEVNAKPETIGEYEKWLSSNHKVDVSKRTSTHFQTVADKVAKDFRESPFWQELATQSRLRDFDESYRRQHNNFPLLASRDPPELSIKPFTSFLLPDSLLDSGS